MQDDIFGKVIFTYTREVVQSVGRVMRNFRKGQPGEKKFGYIIIPVVIRGPLLTGKGKCVAVKFSIDAIGPIVIV